MVATKSQLVAVFALLVAGSMASVDFVAGMQRDFKMGVIVPRAGQNLQTFQGALGGAQASAITQTGDSARPFAIGSDTFSDFGSASDRACDNQHNDCSQIANSKKGSLTVQDCDQQNTQCKAAGQQAAASIQSSIQAASSTSSASSASSSLVSSNAEFDFFCEL